MQDEVQGFHWNKDQCILHPVVIYHRNQLGDLLCLSLCFISDDLEHDTSFVFNLQRQMSEFKETCPKLNRIEFSDECAGQYKNLKFVSPQEDYGLMLQYLVVFCY